MLKAQDLVEMGVTVESLMAAFIPDWKPDWRTRNAEIIPNYMPPYPRKDTQPSVVVKCGEWFLRYSAGPCTGTFWDVYGDDFTTPSYAFKALLESQPPPDGSPYIKFEIPLS